MADFIRVSFLDPDSRIVKQSNLELATWQVLELPEGATMVHLERIYTMGPT